MRAHRVAVVLTACLMLVPLSLSVSPASAQDNPKYFTWFARLGDPESLFTVVYNGNVGTFVLDRNPRSGRIRQRFANSRRRWIAQGIAATRTNRVYMSGNDGMVRKYAPGGANGHHRVDMWTVTVPGHKGEPQLGALTRLRGGYTVVSAILFDNPNFAPVFTGIVVLDRSGGVVTSWAFPDEGLQENAFLLASAVAVAPSGELFVVGTPCADLACGNIVYPDGFLYQLDVARGGDIQVQRQWQSADLVAVRDGAAFSASDLVLVEQGRIGGAFEAQLGDDQLTRVADVPSLSGTHSIATNRARDPDEQTIWLVEGAIWLKGEYIQRYHRDGPSWPREGSPFVATWGRDGPPAPGRWSLER